MRYRELAPPGDLARWVLCFWEFSASRKIQPFVHSIFPDGCIVLSYAPNLPPGVPKLRVSGPLLQARQMVVQPGDSAWGVRLQPAACRAVLGCSPITIVNKTRALTELLRDGSGDALLERLRTCENFRTAVQEFQDFLRRQVGSSFLDEQMAIAADQIARRRGQLKITEIAQTLGLSVRQLQRRFKDAVGLTPKQFARARRFRAAAVALAKTEVVNWADLAADLGFSDQAHLGHEFASVTGIVPTQVGEAVRRIRHGRLLDPAPGDRATLGVADLDVANLQDGKPPALVG